MIYTNSFNSFVDDAFGAIDVLFRDAFSPSSFNYRSVHEENFSINYPMDIIEKENGIQLDIAVVGIDKSDIKIEIEDKNILRVKFDNVEKPDPSVKYLQKKISRKSFNHAWTVNHGDLENIKVTLDKGLLTIFIPKEVEKTKKTININ